mmetsp:Transcript_22364/g.40257  ORF Transcript_22364/g.40257 Transcript_22364/m.40257 type:complete len:210 (+) Transcript_22364:81-710(+)
MGAGQSQAQCGQACFGGDTEGKDILQSTSGMSGTEELESSKVAQLPSTATKEEDPLTSGGQTVVLEYKDDATYTGEVVDGKRQGHGTYKSPVETYIGQWQDDKQHGAGKHTWSDGRAYEGQYVAGRFSGEGKMVWTTDKGIMVYEGQYQDDVKHGHGKFTWPNGNIYEGGWQGGKRHGKAKFLTSAGKQKDGVWKEDKFIAWEEEGAAA